MSGFCATCMSAHYSWRRGGSNIYLFAAGRDNAHLSPWYYRGSTPLDWCIGASAIPVEDVSVPLLDDHLLGSDAWIGMTRLIRQWEEISRAVAPGRIGSVVSVFVNSRRSIYQWPKKNLIRDQACVQTFSSSSVPSSLDSSAAMPSLFTSQPRHCQIQENPNILLHQLSCLRG